MQTRNFKRVGDAVDVPNLVAIQTDSYRNFLQLGVPAEKRQNKGLETIFRETFPIESYDKSVRMEYLRYELGRPRYTPDECRRLGLTYGRPITIHVRLVGPEPIEEGVYLGDMPVMMGGGEFIINGAERVIVSQLHRSPGVDFEVQTHATGKKLYSCRIIPERGSWIELSVSKKDVLSVKIDQSGKFPATTLLRAVDKKYGTTEDLLRLFYQTTVYKIGGPGELERLKRERADIDNRVTTLREAIKERKVLVRDLVRTLGQEIYDAEFPESDTAKTYADSRKAVRVLLHALGQHVYDAEFQVGETAAYYAEAVAAGKSLRTNGFMTHANLVAVAKWKLSATKGLPLDMWLKRFDAQKKEEDKEKEDLDVQNRTRNVFAHFPKSPKLSDLADAFEKLSDEKKHPDTKVNGVAGPIASAILALAYPEQAAIIDVHVWQTLCDLPGKNFENENRGKKSSSLSKEDYVKTVEALDDFTGPELNRLLVERALFIIGWLTDESSSVATGRSKKDPKRTNRIRSIFAAIKQHVNEDNELLQLESDGQRIDERIAALERQPKSKGTPLASPGAKVIYFPNIKAMAKKLVGCIAVGALVNASSGEIIVESGGLIDETAAGFIEASNLASIEVILPEDLEDPLILNTIAEDRAHTYEEALERIYKRLRPGNPFQLGRAQQLFSERFFDANRYRLGRVGRFRLNRKFNQTISEGEMTLRPDDLVNAFKYLIGLRKTGAGTPAGVASGIDDIDHLGNRRVRTIDELAGDEVRKGLLKLRRTAQERMSVKEPQSLNPRTVINPRAVSSAIEYFYGRSELSQVVDQVNPLAQLTHERRLSALGPGGLNRKRAGFEVRDVHTSHYGRICPIETPEGTNIGLIVSLSIFAQLDDYGFLVTPYRTVKNGAVTGHVEMLRADQEDECNIAPADVPRDKNGRFTQDLVMARAKGEFKLIPAKEVHYVDVSPKQLVGISAALIPFLEHDDANRALMGSNMQRQAVPLLTAEPPLIATGLEEYVAQNSGMVVVAEEAGTVKRVTADEIQIDNQIYPMRKFIGLSPRTCLNQKPIVAEGERVKKGQVLADGAATKDGRLALGKNVFVAFMPFDGNNYEDAILMSEKLVKEDVYTSIHIDEFEIEVRETKLGREEFTRDIPNVPERALRNLDDDGIIRVGTRVRPGDVLVGKIAPKSKTELSPEEKLLHAIFGRAGEDVKNESLEVPSGVEGIVIDAQKFSRKAQLTGEGRTADRSQVKKIERDTNEKIIQEFRKMIDAVSEAAGGVLINADSGERLTKLEDWAEEDLLDLQNRLDAEILHVAVPGGPRKGQPVNPKARRIFTIFDERIEHIKDEKDRRVSQIKRGDELPPGVLEMVKVYVATKRTLSVGDKMAGRHGNKGVIARILPEEDMPYLEDGTPVQVVLNPLGVPSRMNLGQILETHLGWAAKTLGYEVVTPVFDGATEEQIRDALVEAGLPPNGKARLYDGRTGRPFDQEVSVGYMYVLKLEHLVDDKVHARATGPYSLITQQPLGGKARSGGQRFGEMEVWALEAYGAAYVLQELLTVKSDDVEGRTRIYEAMVKGENTLIAGTPVSFDVLVNEIKGLGLNIKLEKK